MGKLTVEFLEKSDYISDCGLREFVRIFGHEMDVNAKNIRTLCMGGDTWNRWEEMLYFLEGEFLNNNYTLTEELAEYLDVECGCHSQVIADIMNAIEDLSWSRQFEAFAQIINYSDTDLEEI